MIRPMGITAQQNGKVTGFLFWQQNGLLLLSRAITTVDMRLMIDRWIKMVPYAKVILDLNDQNVACMNMLKEIGFHSTFCKSNDEVTFTPRSK